ncbi:ABATE domain-containing protein [Actinoplanes sp. NPDC024001]|uniref:CGNR zinc finger domain-containing protein n=1 Tax=Actinoplanes sp. NPDC024001 TaxID=3154598 RepID=UPI00340F7B32
MDFVLPSEPRPVRLMNTVWADRGGVHDALTTPADLARWLTATGLTAAEPPATAADLRTAVTLRDALRRLAALTTDDSRAAARSALQDAEAAVHAVNEAAVAGPGRATLQLLDGKLSLRAPEPAADPGAALAVVAAEGIDLLTGSGVLNACYAPGCVLYFVRDHPRREWCSTACGNRARAARHYQRHRTTRTAP